MFFRRLELAVQLKQWHLKVIEIVKRGQHRKSLDKLFQGFKPAVESCYFSWEVAYPLPGVTYCSTEKKSATFSWTRATQLQKAGARACSVAAEGSEPGAGARDPGSSDLRSRSAAQQAQQEAAVRPKETISGKRKGSSGTGAAGMSARLGGGTVLSTDDAQKGTYKSGGSSSNSGKSKLTQGSKGSCGGSNAGGGKHPSAKRRTSSEDSSLGRIYIIICVKCI